MSTLEQIVSDVAQRGRSEIALVALTNTYFRGDNAIEQIEDWARSKGLRVLYSPGLLHECRDSERQVMFYAI
jgi:hypothetical protein